MVGYRPGVNGRFPAAKKERRSMFQPRPGLDRNIRQVILSFILNLTLAIRKPAGVGEPVSAPSFYM
jgi:hypothetical protein